MSNRVPIVLPNGRVIHRPKKTARALRAAQHLRFARMRRMRQYFYACALGLGAGWFLIEIVAPFLDGHVKNMIGGW